MAGLYLDGINDLTCKLEEYKVDTSTDCINIKRDIWLRITIFVHTALNLMRTVILQFFRGTGNILGGIIHLDGERFVMGLNDYFSLLIQAVALPVLGVITFLLPKVGYRLLYNFRQSFDTVRQASDIIYQRDDSIKEACHGFRQGLSEAIMGLFGCLTAFIYTVTSTIEHALSLNFSDAYETLRYTGQLIVISPREGLSSCNKKESSRDIYSAHRIALESFNPSSLE